MIPELALTELRSGTEGADLLVVGPSLGTAVTPLWAACVAALEGDLRVVGWDLPGHGKSATTTDELFVDDLADAVLTATRSLRAEATGRVLYAGVSLGGAVGLQLAVAHADALEAVAIICSGARIGEESAWRERADLVRAAGTAAVVEGSAQRWFAPGFIEREPERAASLLLSLQETDRLGYALCCEALAVFDLRDRLAAVTIPVLAVAGAADVVTPLDLALEIAGGTGGRAVEVEGAAHLAPAERPREVSRVLTDFFAEVSPRSTSTQDAAPAG